jgi:DNA-binding response OmpR family regulator
MLFTNRKKHILIIDDDVSLQRLLHIRLSQLHKYQVSLATTGLQGLELALKLAPNLILLDWMLPDISGPDILEQLKRSPETSHVPVLMLTGRNLLGDVEDAFARGADDYVTKPVALDKLSSKISALLLPPAADL